MDDFDIPILKKSHELYGTFHEYRRSVPKAERFTIYERSENAILDVVKSVLEAGYSKICDKAILLDRASLKLNVLRFLIRLLKETKAINPKKYVALQTLIDDIGRQLGGWMRSTGSR